MFIKINWKIKGKFKFEIELALDILISREVSNLAYYTNLKNIQEIADGFWNILEVSSKYFFKPQLELV